MILRRLGNKKRLADKIQQYFPPHVYYIETFFGAGGMFFNKPKAKYNIVNDIDEDVYNLFNVVMTDKDRLIEMFHMMPIHSALLDYWKENKEIDPLKKALRFLFMSNFLLHGNNGSIRHSVSSGAGGGKDYKDNFESNIKATFDYLYDVNFRNWDFRKFLSTLSFQKDGRNDELKTFIYNDPPYLDTTNNYSDSFSKNDVIDLFDELEKTRCKFAYSEFDNQFILDQAHIRGLNVINIGNRQNIKNIRNEILITNYTLQKTLF